jgi:hypothetical protein
VSAKNYSTSPSHPYNDSLGSYIGVRNEEMFKIMEWFFFGIVIIIE